MKFAPSHIGPIIPKNITLTKSSYSLNPPKS